MKRSKRGLFAIIALILVTGGALAYGTSLPGLSAATATSGKTTGPAGDGDGVVTLSARLSQTKVLQGSDGNVSVSLQLSAAELVQGDVLPDVPVDLVVVIDRSGSMDGDKINDARSAIIKLIGRLTTKDRLALISYSNDVRTDVGLIPVNGANRNRLIDAVNGVQAAGGTNLGGGLQQGIDLLSDRAAVGRQRKLILISDGLANQGVTDPDALARMASTAVEGQFTVSSVGVGYDFNEMLMTSLADHGAGRYYFLENPQAFAKVFEAEFQTARQVAAAGIQLRIPLQNGVRLIHAGGYPISEQGNEAVFYPGDLLSGQQRTLFLTFAVPTNQIGETAINRILVGYTYQGASNNFSGGCGIDRRLCQRSIPGNGQCGQNDLDPEGVAGGLRPFEIIGGRGLAQGGAGSGHGGDPGL